MKTITLDFTTYRTELLNAKRDGYISGYQHGAQAVIYLVECNPDNWEDSDKKYKEFKKEIRTRAERASETNINRMEEIVG